MLEERALLRVQLEVSFSQLLQHLYQPLQLFLEGATKDDNVIDRNPSLCAERITEVIVSGMEVYIPHSLLDINPANPGLTQLALVLFMIERWPTKGT